MAKRKHASTAGFSDYNVADSKSSRSLRSSSLRAQRENAAQIKSQKSTASVSDSTNPRSLDTMHADATLHIKKSRLSIQANVDLTENPTTQPLPLPKIKNSVPTKSARRLGKDLHEPITNIVDSTAESPRNGGVEAEEGQVTASRPPAVNSDYLPLPWEGRLGYACLCTYLRYSNPPVFCSRTTRIASILEHRHPLADPSQPEHSTKNRPDKTQPADVRLGQQFLERLGLANCKDMIKLLRWNDKYGIKFLRLSSEAFPFASHAVYGNKLAPFASNDLREVGLVIAELGHRVSTHPGQFTQLGSPRQSVIEASIRDLEYHDEMLSLLNLPPQQNRDAVMVLHMGGVYGDKSLTLSRFRDNYSRLSQSVKNRLVLENDDVSWSVHDLLPICEELNIPLVLDFHHHNIIHDSSIVREGTQDIIKFFPRIKSTWTRKKITQKMHYSEPNSGAITARERRKHSPRVAYLPPCPNDMDLMIEAKDKEQAVFELMKIYKLPGHGNIKTIIPHVRDDINPSKHKGKGKGQKPPVPQTPDREGILSDPPSYIAEDEIGMGGAERRVYWPPGMEHWLRPPKRGVVDKEPVEE